MGVPLGSRDACPAVIVALIALLRESGSVGVHVALGADGEDLELVGGSHGRVVLGEEEGHVGMAAENGGGRFAAALVFDLLHLNAGAGEPVAHGEGQP